MPDQQSERGRFRERGGALVPRRCLRTAGRLKALLVTVAVLSLALMSPAAEARDSGRDVPVPNNDRFQKVLLEETGLTQPMRISVAPDGRVVYIERDGRVKVWDPQQEKVGRGRHGAGEGHR
ncbi:hypothetical protein STENM327S_07047 [Streptomyces tendae]